MARKRKGYVPGRYDRKRGASGYELAQNRMAKRIATGDQPNPKPVTGREIPKEETNIVIDWCEPLDPMYLTK